MAPDGRRLLAAILLACLLTGCWDRAELEDQAYVVALGVDRVQADGRLMVTARVALAQSLTAGILRPARPGGPGLAAQLLTSEAGTVTQAVHILNGSMTRRLDLRHLRAVLVGEELARAGLEPVVMELMRSPLPRETAALILARGRAFDLMAADTPVGEINPARYEEGWLLQQKQLHLAPPTRLYHFVNRLAAPGGDPILTAAAVNPWIRPGPQEPATGNAGASALAGQLPRGGGNPVEQVGTAIFSGDRLRGFISADETQMLLALRGEMGKAYASFPDPDAPGRAVSMRFHQESLPRYRVSFRQGRPHVAVDILFEGELLAIPGGTDYTRPEARRRLERAAARFAEETIRGLLEKLRGWGADPVGFGHLFRGRFATWSAWQAYDWRSRAGDLSVDATVAMRIRRYGLFVAGDRVDGGR